MKPCKPNRSGILNLRYLQHGLSVTPFLPVKKTSRSFLNIPNALFPSMSAWITQSSADVAGKLKHSDHPSLASTSRPCRLDLQLTWYPKPLSCSHQPGITMLESPIHSQVLHANNHQPSLVSQLHLLRKTLPRTLVHFHKNSKVKAAHMMGWGVRIVIWSGK